MALSFSTFPDASRSVDHTEPDDEDDWAFDEPLRYGYAAQGNLSAMGRVTGNEVRAGEGEPYFVERGSDGRIERVIYPDAGSGNDARPEYEYRYKYAPDGRVSEVALVYTYETYKTEYGPEKYVIQFSYDDAGRMVRKVVRDNSQQDSKVRYETSYEFDGMGRMTRERVMKWDDTNERMVVLQDKRTTYDLGDNATEIKFYDNEGWAYTETRSYARGYQLTGFSTSAAGDVTINTAGSYTYDTNNNLTGTKKFDASRNGTKLSYRAQWEFTFDRKNRLKTYENISAADNVQGNLWYDGKGRVWQRWNYDTNLDEWSANLKRFVYDGSALVQEHSWTAAIVLSAWVYTYGDLTRDYLRHAAGLRQRERSGGNDTDYFLQQNAGALEYKVERDPTAVTAYRTERSSSLDQISGASFTSGLSNLATSGDYVEMYGDSTTGFDMLIQKGSRHRLVALGSFMSRRGNHPYDPYATTPKGSRPVMPSPGRVAEAGPGEMQTPGGGAQPGDDDEAIRRMVNDCCWEEWTGDECGWVDHFYTYCCTYSSCVYITIMCPGMMATCQDYLCGLGDAHIRPTDRWCLCNELSRQGVESDDDWQNKGSVNDRIELMERVRERCHISIPSVHRQGCAWANCDPLLINLTAAVNECYHRGTCPQVPETPIVWFPIAASFCCLDYEAIADKLEKHVARGCKWLSKLFGVREDFAADCCNCVVHQMVDQILTKCNELKLHRPYGCA